VKLDEKLLPIERTSLEITESRAFQQTAAGRKSGSASSDFSGMRLQVLEQLANREAGLQQLNHLLGTDSNLCAQFNDLGDSALERVHFGRAERILWIIACECGHSYTPHLQKHWRGFHEARAFCATGIEPAPAPLPRMLNPDGN